ncbi:MAG: DnaB-like helicase C-terminal domain-containing protein, partial [Gemmatimonadota bacterium]
MDQDRLLERALAIEGRLQVDEMRAATLTDLTRSSLGAAAVRLRNLPLEIIALTGATYDETLAAARREDPDLVVIDYLQLISPPETRNTVDEDCASSVRALKAATLGNNFVCLTVAQLPGLDMDRQDRRPSLDDFGSLGAVKQHSDVVLGIYREEMYSGGPDVEGATELIVAKNRNGPTGFIDLYFYQQWMRFEDMLDPDR